MNPGATLPAGSDWRHFPFDFDKNMYSEDFCRLFKQALKSWPHHSESFHPQKPTQEAKRTPGCLRVCRMPHVAWRMYFISREFNLPNLTAVLMKLDLTSLYCQKNLKSRKQ